MVLSAEPAKSAALAIWIFAIRVGHRRSANLRGILTGRQLRWCKLGPARPTHTRAKYGPWHDPPDPAPGAVYLRVLRIPPAWSVGTTCYDVVSVTRESFAPHLR